MADLTPDEIARGEALLGKTSPTPWSREWNEADCPDSGIDINSQGCRVALVECLEQDEPEDDPLEAGPECADADAIVWLRNNAAALIAAAKERDELRAEVERLRGLLRDARVWIADEGRESIRARGGDDGMGHYEGETRHSLFLHELKEADRG